MSRFNGIPFKANMQNVGRFNKAVGKEFEELIERSCQAYAAENKALIDKTPEPMRVVRRMNDGAHFTCVFEKKAQPDFKGTLKGGQAIVFEAKFTNSGQIRQDAVTYEQAKCLDLHQALGAECFVLVCFSFESFCRIPWPIWTTMKELYGRKYMTCTEAEIVGKVPFTGSRIMFL